MRSQGTYLKGTMTGGIIVLCTLLLVSYIFFNKRLYFSYYMAGYLCVCACACTEKEVPNCHVPNSACNLLFFNNRNSNVMVTQYNITVYSTNSLQLSVAISLSSDKQDISRISCTSQKTVQWGLR